jgi:uncharacterized protein YodC (DUF2158 family)
MSFSEGDIVLVKSGGPALTVLSTEGEHVKCLFFSEELGEFRETLIPAFALEVHDESDDEDEEEDETESEDEEDEEDEDEKDDKAA